MSIDSKVIQLEFPFLNKVRMQLYIEKQRQEMRSIYDLSYRFDGDHGQEMRFGDFIADIWIKGGYAKRFHEHYYQRYFYDKQN